MSDRLRASLLTCIAALVAVAAVNYLINPAGVFVGYSWAGINQYKPTLALSLYVVKPRQAGRARNRNLDLLILGSSRVGGSLDPDTPELANVRAYNFALPAASIYQIRQSYRHMRDDNIPGVLLGLDFFTFNHRNGHNTPGSNPSLDRRLLWDTSLSQKLQYWYQTQLDSLQFLLSLDALQKSIATVDRQAALQTSETGVLELENSGFWRNRVGQRYKINRHFERGLDFSAKRFCNPTQAFTFDDSSLNSPSTLSQLEYLLQELYADGTEVRIVIPPVHAWYLAVLHECGTWQTRENWKRALVAINTSVAKDFSRTPFPVFDFSTLNAMTTEPVPDAQSMQWFLNIDHPTVAAGQQMLREVYDRGFSGKKFAVILTENTINQALLSERIDMESHLAVQTLLKNKISSAIARRLNQVQRSQ